MEASPAKVINYFNGEKQNLIPLFQRPYKWSQDNWKTLWDDVLVQYDQQDRSTHFMGAIVSVPARSVPVGVNKFLIIDGQQRLSTISILLCALRDSVADKNSVDRIQEVYLTNKFRETDDTLKFVPTQADREVYRAMVLDRQVPATGSLMVEAYHYFMKQLRESDDLNGDSIDPLKVLTALEHSLEVVMINLGDSDDPYLIFESLNFKGEPLNQADLVRNYLLMRFRHSISAGGEQERIYSQYWRPMEVKVGDNLTEFLRHYSMKDGDNIRQGGIYAAVKARLKSLSASEQVEEEMRQMLRFGEYYSQFLNPDLIFDSELRTRLRHLHQLEVTTSFPMLLRLFESHTNGELTKEELLKGLALIESFVVRRAVCGVPTNALNKLFLQWAKSYPTTGHIAWLHAAMSQGKGGRRFPTDEEFGEAFTNQPQYGRGPTRFILEELENQICHKEPITFETVSIEHVLPQTLTPEWREELGEGAESIHSRLVNTIGNLTLTGYNPELSNSSFAEKKAKLQTTHVELNRWILEQSSWNEAKIVERAQAMLKSAKKLWTGPVT